MKRKELTVGQEVEIQTGSGVAVAVVSQWQSHGNVVTWHPEVIQLRKLQPKGTQAAYVRQEERQHQLREADARTREGRATELRRRAGVESKWDLRFRYVTPHGATASSYVDSSVVEIKTTELERLLDELEQLRSS